GPARVHAHRDRGQRAHRLRQVRRARVAPRLRRVHRGPRIRRARRRRCMRRLARARGPAPARRAGLPGTARRLPGAGRVNPFGFDDRPVHIAVAGRSDPGQKRAENQDNFLVADLSRDALDGGLLLTRDPQAPPRRCDLTLGPKGVLALVADGMGGAAAGAIASQMAVAWIYRALLTGWGADRNNAPQQFALRLREAVEETNTRIHAEAQANPEYRGMGTTATAAGLLDGFLYLAQVGDSRAYLVRRGGIAQLTRDQSFVQTLIDAGTL